MRQHAQNPYVVRIGGESLRPLTRADWIPAFAGMSGVCRKALGPAVVVIALSLMGPSHAQNTVPGYQPGEESAEEFPAGAGREETFYACIACHNFKLVAAQGLTREQWDETVTLMTRRHNMPAIEGDERKVILDYLASAFSPMPGSR